MSDPFVRLSRPQTIVYTARDHYRFRVLVTGRRFGKTTLILTEQISDAPKFPGDESWLILPTYRQAKNVGWRKLKSLVPEYAIESVNESELIVTFVNDYRICLKGADNPDSLRGVGLRSAGLDEYASMKPEVFDEIIRPALSDLQGWALFGGSPQGYNHFYDLYQRGQDPDSIGWKSWQFTTEAGGFVPPDEIEAARRDLDPRTFRQEYLASFESMSGRVYYAFDRHVNVDPDVRHINEMGGVQLIVGQDFNVSPGSAVFGYRVADEIHVFDELEMMDSNTAEMGAEIARRYGHRGLTLDEHSRREQFGHIEGNIGTATRRRDIRICPDPSGKARKTSAVVGETDFTILRGFGFTIDAPTSAPAVVDRINTVNTALCDASGRYRVKIHPRCKKLIKGLDGMTYKPGTKQPDKDSGLDHITDAMGYLCCQEFGVAGSRASSIEVNL